MQNKHTFEFSMNEAEIKNALYDFFVRQHECQGLVFNSKDIVILGYSVDNGEIDNLEAVLIVKQSNQ